MKSYIKTQIIGNYLHIWIKKPNGVTTHIRRKIK